MLRAGLDLSRRRLDVCLIAEFGEVGRPARYAAGCRGPAPLGRLRRAWRGGGARVIESMTGARFVRDKPL
jgi:hypothetical protein